MWRTLIKHPKPKNFKHSLKASWWCVWLAALHDAALQVQASSRGHFSLGVNIGSDSIPPQLLDESIKRGLVCAHMHSHAQTQKVPTCSRWVNAGNKNTPSKHHPQRRNLTTSISGLQNGHICTNFTQKDKPQRYSWEHRRRRKSQLCLESSGTRSSQFPRLSYKTSFAKNQQ